MSKKTQQNKILHLLQPAQKKQQLDRLFIILKFRKQWLDRRLASDMTQQFLSFIGKQHNTAELQQASASQRHFWAYLFESNRNQLQHLAFQIPQHEDDVLINNQQQQHSMWHMTKQIIVAATNQEATTSMYAMCGMIMGIVAYLLLEWYKFDKYHGRHHFMSF